MRLTRGHALAYHAGMSDNRTRIEALQRRVYEIMVYL
jgi:hypothetical protein